MARRPQRLHWMVRHRVQVSIGSDKAKLLAAGVLLTVAVESVMIRDRSVPTRPSPCAPAGAGDSVGAFTPHADLDPLHLEGMQRVQQVAPAGSRDLFSYVDPKTSPRRSSVTASVAAALAGASSPVSHAGGIADSARRVFFYGYTVRRGSPLLAFLLMDDDILLVSKGEIIRGRYYIAELGPSALTIEDIFSGDREIVPLLGPCER